MDVYTADLNGDGRDDFFLYNRTNGVWVEAFSQAGIGTFDYPASGQWDPGWRMTPADLNGDGRTDLFLLNAAGRARERAEPRGRRLRLRRRAAVGAGLVGRAGDLNDDGRTDLFLYKSDTGVWVEAFSDGAGGFTYRGGPMGSGLDGAR